MLKLAFTLASVALIATSPALARDPVKSAAAALSTNASTAASTTVAASAAAIAAASDRQRYCIIDTPTGSHIPTKVCKTRTEWRDYDNFDPLVQQ